MNRLAPPHKALLDSLLQAWSVESKMETLLIGLYREGTNAETSRLYAEHLRVTKGQKHRLQSRLLQLGELAVFQPGGFVAALNSLDESSDPKSDPLQRDDEQARASYVRAQLECAMYRSIKAQAVAIRDRETARLAVLHLKEEEFQARRLWPYLSLLADLAEKGRHLPGRLAHLQPLTTKPDLRNHSR